MTAPRLTKLLNQIQVLDKRLIFMIVCVLELAVFAADLLTGLYIPFGSYYLLPISLAAWCLGIWPTILFIFISSLLRHYALIDLIPEKSSVKYFLADMITAVLIYSLVSFLLIQLKRAYQELAIYTGKLKGRVERAEKRERLESSIRRAVLSDLEAIIELTGIGGEDGDFSNDVTTLVRQQTLRATFSDSIQGGTGSRPTWVGGTATVPIEFWVADIGHTIAGYFMLMGLDQKQGAERELHAIAVAREFRGQGVGTAMVDFLCAHYYGRRLYAACMPNSAMRKMLKRRGFFHFSDTKQGYVIVERIEWPQDKGLLNQAKAS